MERTYLSTNIKKFTEQNVLNFLTQSNANVCHFQTDCKYYLLNILGNKNNWTMKHGLPTESFIWNIQIS